MSHTSEFYAALSIAYSYFNTELFYGSLPDCLITAQSRKKAYGYFSPARFSPNSPEEKGHEISAEAKDTENRKNEIDEISLNPIHFKNRTPKEILSTLVHEMVHLRQHHFGTPPKAAYHNKEWAAMMDEIGLTPSSTEAPGGKRTGVRMTHYIAPGGPYERAANALLDNGFTLPYIGLPGHLKPKAAGQTKYVCPNCSLKAYGKKNINILCGLCNKQMKAES